MRRKKMTEKEIIDMDAACIFKDYTHLQLKAFQVHMQNEKKFTGGGDATYDEKVLAKALEYHRYYLRKKLNETKEKRNDKLF